MWRDELSHQPSVSPDWESPFVQHVQAVCAAHLLVAEPSCLSHWLLWSHSACVHVSLRSNIFLTDGTKEQE